MNPDSIKTGGPAFPFVESEGPCNVAEGMTLRDYFAAKAMQGLLASDATADMEEFSSRAYRMADAMLAARG